jgi:hypothetical protein
MLRNQHAIPEVILVSLMAMKNPAIASALVCIYFKNAVNASLQALQKRPVFDGF